MAKSESTKSKGTTAKAKPPTASKADGAARKKLSAADDGLLVAVPSHEDIARRAFELYQARGGANGDELSDWLRAEHELSTPEA